MDLSARQERERAYHAMHARRLRPRKPDIDIVSAREPRPWNAYWEAVWRLRREELAAKRALVVGCGAGQDAIILSRLGASVDAFDLSPDMLAVAKRSAADAGVDIRFQEASAECMPYDEAAFDLIFVRDILHHVDIDTTIREILRIGKPGALIIVSEIYCHSSARWVRQNLVGWAAPIAHRLTGSGVYETEDEEPLTEHDMQRVRSIIDVESERYFCALAGRFVPQTERWGKLDRYLAGRMTGGRVLLTGQLAQEAKPC